MLAHGIAHNLVCPHNLEHEFYVSAICSAYLEPLFNLLSDGPQLFTHMDQPVLDTHQNNLSRCEESTDGPTARHPLSLFANDD